VTKKEDALTVLHGTGSASTREVAERGDMPQGTAQKTLSRLAAEEKVGRTDDGRWHIK
jgi:DNA-binding IclR family transcriptional regulator